MFKFAFLLALTAGAVQAGPKRDADQYAAGIEKINAAHAKRPGNTTEQELADKTSPGAMRLLQRILDAEPTDETADALVTCGQAALDLSLIDHFAKTRTRLLETAPDSAAELGDATARERFLVHAIGEFDDGYLEDFADLTDAILDAYYSVFGFDEWSKVPGKKIRIYVHLEERILKPPHFAPQFPYHSQIDMPVVHSDRFQSPTRQGQMMFYGLCHELGHLIAMWGDRKTQEDHHAWAHYTGVAIVEHMAGDPKYKELLASRRDVRWRSLSIEREKAGVASLDSREGVLALLVKLHDTAGPAAIGAAMNLMDEKGEGHRINHVRYYGFDDLKRALKASIDEPKLASDTAKLFP